MIKIESKLGRDLDQLCNDHYSMLKPFILDRIRTTKLRKRQLDYLRDESNLESIIKAKPKDLLLVYKDYKAHCTAPGTGKITKIKYNLNKIFDYNYFSKKTTPIYNGYDFTEKLKVNTCPYCNRNFITTIYSNTEKIIRPDIDHFHAQSDYPLLALSFYNLIPSCLVCNRSLKGKKKVQSCLNPYADGFGQTLKFNYFAKDVASAKGLSTSFSITFLEDKLSPTKVKSCNKNVELFKLDKIYEMSHSNEIAEIIRRYEMSGGRYLEVLKRTFPELGSLEELYNIAFGNYYTEIDHDKRPLAKLTRDTVEQLQFYLPPSIDQEPK
jgi:hypothetical protein